MLRFLKLFGVISVITLLSGCSREPSQDELINLYNDKIKNTNNLAQKITQQTGTIIQVKNFEKIDCTKIKDTQDYLCRAHVTLSLPFLGEQQNTAELRVTKGENGWVNID